MSKKIIVAVAVILLLGAALVFSFGCAKKDQGSTDISTDASSAIEDETKESETAEAVDADKSDTTVTENTTEAAAGIAPSAAEKKTPVTETAASAATKKGVIYKVAGDSKIWANTVGQAYILFKDIDTPNEWGEKGKVYELYVAQFGDDYSMWSDGYWSIDENSGTLKLSPKNQSENGNVGVDAGKTKTIIAENGVYVINVSFSSGGKTTMKLKP